MATTEDIQANKKDIEGMKKEARDWGNQPVDCVLSTRTIGGQIDSDFYIANPTDVKKASAEESLLIMQRQGSENILYGVNENATHLKNKAGSTAFICAPSSGPPR